MQAKARCAIAVGLTDLVIKGALLPVVALFVPVPETSYYGHLALSIARGAGFRFFAGASPVLWRGPAYPYFLAGIYRLTDESQAAVVVAQMVLDALSCALLFLLAARVLSRRRALICAGLYCLYPFSAYYVARLMPETLFTALVLLSVAIWLTIQTAPGVLRSAVLGVLLGALALCRPAMLLFPVVVAGHLWLTWRGRAAWKCLLPLLLCAAATISPWTYRNYALTGRFIPITTGGGWNLWVGNYVPADGRDFDELSGERLESLKHGYRSVTGRDVDLRMYDHDFEVRGQHDEPLLLDPNKDALFMRAALEHIRHGGTAVAGLLLKKAGRFWADLYSQRLKKYQPAAAVLQWSLVILGVCGFLLNSETRRLGWPLVLPIAYSWTLHALTVSTMRYGVPYVPLLLALAFWGLTPAERAA
jgi:4-amino-4-deoxy-L-arabinose transferase-like glycosyltransferase